MKHIVLYSGGLGSYFTAKRLLETVAKEDMILLFTDTKYEDKDLYRFLDDTTKFLGIPLTNFSDGRDIWRVFQDVKFLGNSRIDPCSRVLKREPSRKFIEQFKPDECKIYLGFDWTEMHRLVRAKKAWLPYIIEAPLCDKPYIDKDDMKKLLVNDGIELPYLYTKGLAHNNCSGFCVKAGIGHYITVLKNMPERYAEFEAKEQEIRDYIGKDVTVLRRVRNGVKTNLTLTQLRKEYEAGKLLQDELWDIGGCGCFIQ